MKFELGCTSSRETLRTAAISSRNKLSMVFQSDRRFVGLSKMVVVSRCIDERRLRSSYVNSSFKLSK